MLGSGVLLHVLFILYYLHPICETKILWPNSLTKVPSVSTWARMQALVSKWKILQDSRHYPVTQEGCQKHMEGLPW